MTIVNSLYRHHSTITLATEDRDGIATAQTTAGAGNLTLAGALTSGGVYTAGDGSGVSVGHQVSAYCAGDINTVVFTVTGTDPDGLAQTDTITGVNASTVETTKYFKTVTQVAASATCGTNVEIGIVDEIATQRIPIEPRTTNFSVGMGCDITGTASVTVQLTMDNLYDPDTTPNYIADTTFATKTSTFFSQLGVLCSAVRLVTNSYSTSAVLNFHVIQNK